MQNKYQIERFLPLPTFEEMRVSSNESPQNLKFTEEAMDDECSRSGKWGLSGWGEGSNDLSEDREFERPLDSGEAKPRTEPELESKSVSRHSSEISDNELKEYVAEYARRNRAKKRAAKRARTGAANASSEASA